MIYIKDYRSLNSLIDHDKTVHNDIRSILIPFIGRAITVFVNSGGASSGRYTGILVDVLSDSIKLITKPPQMAKNDLHNNGIRFNHSRGSKAPSGMLGTKTYILINHITALAYHSK